MGFSSSQDVVHAIPVLRLSGEIDLSAADDLTRAVEELIARGGSLLIVDLADVTFFDSAGLKVLDDAQQQAATRGARLALASPPGRVMRLFEITGLDEHFSIHSDAEQASTDNT